MAAATLAEVRERVRFQEENRQLIADAYPSADAPPPSSAMNAWFLGGGYIDGVRDALAAAGLSLEGS